MSLARITHFIAQDLAAYASHLLDSKISSAIEEDVMDNWRIDCMILFLQSWCCILDSSLMFPWQPQEAVVDMKVLKNGLQSIGFEVFRQLYECILKSTVYDSLSSKDDDEDEDNENIEGKSFDEIIASVATIGRSSFVNSAAFLSTALRNSLEQLQSISLSPAINQNSLLFCLENVRITLLFVSHICNENYSSKSSLENRRTSNENTMIPSFVIDSFINHENTGTSMHSLVEICLDHFKFQVDSLVSPHLGSLSSPLLISLLLRYLDNFLRCYGNVDPNQYDPEVQHQASRLFQEFGKRNVFHTITTQGIMIMYFCRCFRYNLYIGYRSERM